MSPILIQIMVGAFSASIGALITFFVVTATTKNMQKVIANEIVTTHEKIHHQIKIQDILDAHEKNCPARKDYKAMRDGIVFLVLQANGNIKELGLAANG